MIIAVRAYIFQSAMKIDQQTLKQLLTVFPFLDQTDEFLDRFLQVVTVTTAPKKYEVIRQGYPCYSLDLILEGSVRVYKLSESGREITLYRIGPGESCIVTASCIINNIRSPVLAETETPIKSVSIPSSTVKSWLEEFSEWRHFIFDLVSRRLSEVIEVIEEVAFRRMDTRVAEWLLKQTHQNAAVQTTHQHIAEELGTAREVVTRILKDFSDQGFIHLKRGEIVILDDKLLRLKSAHTLPCEQEGSNIQHNS